MRISISIISAIIFFSIWINKSFAQEATILSKEFSYSQTFAYNAEQNTHNLFSNSIIQEIAKSIQKRVDFTKFNVSYILSQRIQKIDSMHYKVVLEIKNFNVSGDISYRGINAKKALIPNEYDFELSVSRKKNTDESFIIFLKKFSNIPLNSKLGYYSILDMPFSDTIANCQYLLNIDKQKMYFNESGKTKFIQFMTIVNDYYNCENTIHELHDKLDKIDITKIDLLSFYNVELKEIERGISNIEAAQYPQTIGLYQNDPIEYTKKMSLLKQSTNKMRANLNQKLSVLDMIYYTEGTNKIAEGNLKEAEKYFKKSLEVNQFYAPSQYKLAKMSYDKGEIEKAAEMINTALTKMNPDPVTQQSLIEFGKTIGSTLLKRGNEESAKQLFSEAISTLEKAKWFCNNTPGILCEEDLFKSLATARYGIYYSYLQVAEKALQNKRLDIAGNYINQSLEYQKEYSSEIITASESMTLMSKLTNAYNNDGIILNNNQKYEAALNQFYKIDSLQKRFPKLTPVSNLETGFKNAHQGIYSQAINRTEKLLNNNNLTLAEANCNEASLYQQKHKNYIPDNSPALSLLNNIKEKFYIQFINDGQNKLNISDNKTALEILTKAKDLEKNYSFTKIDSLDIFIRIAAKPVVLENIKAGQTQAWGNKLDLAKSTFNQSSTDIQTYKLSDDDELQNELKKLKEQIFAQECNNAENDYKNKIASAKTEIDKKNYIIANDYLKQALSITSCNILCNIDNSFAISEKNKIKPAVEFQTLTNEAIELSKKNNYTEAINKFCEAEKHFKANHLDTLGIEYLNIETIIKKSEDINFVYFGTEYFYAEKKYPLSFNLLCELMKKSYPIKLTKAIQTQLGCKMAIHDKIANPEANYNINVLRYTEGEKYLSIFAKSYKKTWRKN